ncbi:MAG: type II toxin-antitoxin system PemK/MazF family toxin [Chloroflexota bacterium]
MVIIAPLTTTPRRVASHVSITAPQGGLDRPRFIMCEAVRSVSTERLVHRFGLVDAPTIEAVEDRLRILLGL